MKQSVLQLVLILLTKIIYCHGSCNQVLDHGVTKADEATILSVHNEIRQKLRKGQLRGQPKGTGFKTYKYDAALAKEAQIIADTCEFEHVRVTDGRWKIGVGQNLYMSMSSRESQGASWKNAIQSWIDEHKDYRYGGPINGLNGHYTQVIWADSEYVGCGYTSYLDPSSSMRYQKLYVCNYGPAGNVMGQLPYKKG